jgi:hypothetical protein
MKSWLIFGSGTFVGLIIGAFFAAFLLLDDATQTQLATPTSLSHARISPKKQAAKVEVAHSDSKTEVNRSEAKRTSLPKQVTDSKPIAISAEALDLDSLPPATEDNVISTAKRDQSSSEDQNQ